MPLDGVTRHRRIHAVDQSQPLYLCPERYPEDPATRALLEEFATRGYIVFDLDTPNFEAVANRLIDDVSTRYGDAGRIGQAWRKSPDVRELALSSQVFDMLRKLYGREPFAFQTLNFNVGTEQATHSDTIHFDSDPADFMCGVWVALEDIDADNGPLQYYPGSQHERRLNFADCGHPDVGQSNRLDLYKSAYEPMIQQFVLDKGFVAEYGHLRRGQALVWSANLLHGGGPVLAAGRSRHSQVTHYYFEGCNYFTPHDSSTNQRSYRHPYNLATNSIMAGSKPGAPMPVPIANRVKDLVAHRLGIPQSWLRSLSR